MSAIILNFWPGARAYGHVSALQSELKRRGLVQTIAIGGSRQDRGGGDGLARDFVRAFLALQPSHVFLIGSPTAFDLESVPLAILKDRLHACHVTYWEPDAWGRGKPAPPSVHGWLRKADTLLHVGGISKIRECAKPDAQVWLAPHPYSHHWFAALEAKPPKLSAKFSVGMLANNVTRTGVPIPWISGLHGGFQRWVLASKLRRRHGDSLLLGGVGWPSAWSGGAIDYENQGMAARSAAVTANWDHFTSYPEYTSDRLAISMLAGRPHVSSAHPSLAWGPPAGLGVFFESSVREVVCRVSELLELPQKEQLQAGAASWDWARERLSTRTWARYVVDLTLDGHYSGGVDLWQVAATVN